uniref:Uncharacterized protein n=1 Tax=Tanacetum cinerariifolium TaxID=118510 RepID=A0A699J4F4_TANCI|nr:hypothetical protein [Tanacetum cinerariifolium]GFA07774.1 hypothetical protein [Tanacetum cinerariifolium]
MMPEDSYAYVEAALHAPPFPSYVPGLEHPPTPEFVLEPVYPEFMPPKDDVLPAEEQPLLAAFSPTADLRGYIPESNHEDDPEEDDEDPEEDLTNYPTDRDDDDKDEEEEESSRDEADDEEEDKDEDEEEEGHLSPVDSIPPPLLHRTTTRISIYVQVPTPFLSEVKIDRLLAIPSPPPLHFCHCHYHYLKFPHHHYQYHHLYLYHLHHYLLALPVLWDIELL